MARETRGEALSRCAVMLAGAKNHEEEPGVQELLFQFEVAFNKAKEAQAERAGHRAKAQLSSRDFDQFFVTTMDYYSRLRRIFQAKYGTRSEILAEFGLIPLRPAKKATSTPQAPEQTPPEQVQSATQTATPAADSWTEEVIIAESLSRSR